MSPDFDQDGWELESAVARHDAYPDTFSLPSDQDLGDLETGDQVKLLFWFLDDDGVGHQVAVCERKWVTLESSSGTALIGRLATDPIAVHAPLHAGDRVEFELHHVCDVLTVASQQHLASLPPDEAMAAWEAAHVDMADSES